jgi:DHA1 family inner membrane transport protein
MGGLTLATIAGSPLGTLVGQHAGWRAMYGTVVASGLRSLAVWKTVAVASPGTSSRL